MANQCVTERKNIGKSKCNTIPQIFKYMLWTPNDFALDEDDLATGAALKTALQDLIKESSSERGVLWPAFSRIEPKSEETKYVESPLGTRKSRDGNYRFMFFVAKDLCTHKNMYSQNTTEGRVMLVDNELNGLLTKDSDGKYRGLSVDMINVEKLKLNSGDDLTESPIYVSLANSKEVEKSGFMFDFSVITELEPLTDADLEIVQVIDTDNFTMSVSNGCDGQPVSGLVAADFSVLTAAGAAQAPDTVTEPNNDGVYLFTRAANFVDGTVNLKSPNVLSLNAYESTGAVALNAP